MIKSRTNGPLTMDRDQEMIMDNSIAKGSFSTQNLKCYTEQKLNNSQISSRNEVIMLPSVRSTSRVCTNTSLLDLVSGVSTSTANSGGYY